MFQHASFCRHRHILAGLLVALAVVGVVRLVAILPACAERNDFAHYYVSSHALLAGENPYTVSLAHHYAEFGFEFDERIPHATNPPALLWLFAPFAAMPPLLACLLWQAVQLISLLTMFALTWSLTRSRLRTVTLLAIALAVILSNPLYWHIYHSQVQLLLGAMLLSAFWLNRHKRHNIACGIVVAAGLLKLFPLVLLPWFLWRTGEDWPARMKRAVLVGVGSGMMILLTGPQLWSHFIHHGLEVVTSNAVNRTFNFGLPSLLGNLTQAYYNFQPPAEAVRLSQPIGMFAGLCLIGVGYIVCLIGRQNREQQFSLLCLAMLAGSATMWGHYLVMLVFPGVIAALSVRKTESLLPKMAVGAALLMIAMAGTGTPPALAAFPMLNVLSHYLPLLAVVILIVTLSRSLLNNDNADVLVNLPLAGLKLMFSRPPVRSPKGGL